MGWKKLKADDNRLFAIRNILWGLPANTLNESPCVFPILEAGDHVFPFICQLPMINYPPTFHHHLIATVFSMVASVITIDDTVSKSVPICFQSIVETMSLQSIYTEEHKLTNHTSTVVTVPRLSYNINEHNQSIPIKVQFNTDKQEHLNISHLRVYIKRYYKVKYKTSSRHEEKIVAYYDHSKLLTTSSKVISLKLNIPDSTDLFPATLNYSTHLSVEYKLVVTVKIHHGPISLKKKLFEMPITFGTLSLGTRAPRQLEPYSDIKENRASINCKPTFLRPVPKQTLEEECLPAYDDAGMPPAYVMTSRCSSHHSLRSIAAA